MKIQLETLKLTHVVSVMPLLDRRAQATASALFLTTLRPKRDVPMSNVAFRSLGLLFTHLAGAPALKQDAPAVLEPTAAEDACVKMATAFLNIALAVEDLATAARMRFLQLVMDRKALGATILAAAQLDSEPLMSMEALVELIVRGHSSGPRGTEMDVLRQAGRWASLRVNPSAAAPFETLYARALVIRCQEMMVKYLHTPNTVEQNDLSALNPDMVANALSRLFRSIAVTMAALPFSALTAIITHLRTVTAHPWFRQQLDTTTLLKMEDMLRVADTTLTEQHAWDPWPELQQADLWDSDIIRPFASGMMGLAESDVPARTVDLLDVQEYALYADLTSRVRLADNAPTVLLNSLQTALDRALRLQTTLRAAIKEGNGEAVQFGGSAIALPPPSSEVVRRPGRLANTAGYPVVTDADVWNPAPPSDLAAIRRLNLSRMNFYTTEGIAMAMSDPYHGHQPVFIQGTAPLAMVLDKPPIMPAIEGWSDETLWSEPSLDALTLRWGTSDTELRRTLSLLPPDPAAPLLRAHADALRFVGVLATVRAVESGSRVTLVLPSAQHWYHLGAAPMASAVTALWELAALQATGESVDAGPAVAAGQQVLDFFTGSRPIVLGKLGREDVSLVLFPFTRIPASCVLRPRAGVLMELDYVRTQDEASLVRWIANSPVGALWNIRGWTSAPSDNIGDIIAVPFSRGRDQYIEVMGESELRPRYAARPNAVVALWGDEPPVMISPPVVSGLLEAELPILP